MATNKEAETKLTLETFDVPVDVDGDDNITVMSLEKVEHTAAVGYEQSVITVAGLIKVLRSLPEKYQHLPVVMSSDAEGNQHHYLFAVEPVNRKYADVHNSFLDVENDASGLNFIPFD